MCLYVYKSVCIYIIYSIYIFLKYWFKSLYCTLTTRFTAHISPWAHISRWVRMTFWWCICRNHTIATTWVSVVDVCKNALFSSLQNASKLVASSPKFGQLAQERDSFKCPKFFRQGTSLMCRRGTSIASVACRDVCQRSIRSVQTQYQHSIRNVASVVYRRSTSVAPADVHYHVYHDVAMIP